MALKKLDKITDAQLKAMGVSALADKPNAISASQYGQSGLSAALLKAWFDKLGILLAERLNQLVELLSTEDACEHIAIPDGVIANATANKKSLLDFLKAFSTGEAAKSLLAYKNESAAEVMPLQMILYDIAVSLSGNREIIDLHSGMINDLNALIMQNAEMCSSNSKDAEGNIVSHAEILTKILAVYDELNSKIGNAQTTAKSLIQSHNASQSAHPYLLTRISAAQNKANDAYNLASGKSTIHPMYSTTEFMNYARNEPDKYNVGDVFIFYEKDIPDFILFKKNTAFVNGYDDVDLTEGYLPEGFEFHPGMRLFINGLLFVVQENGVDISKFATNDELQTAKDTLEEEISRIDSSFEELQENNNTQFDEIKERFDDVEKAIVWVNDETSSTVLVESGKVYNLGLKQELTLNFPDEIDDTYMAIVNFRVGSTELVFDCPANLYFSGDDSYQGRFYPIKHRIYEINIAKTVGVLVARVGCVDFEVIE